MCKSVNFGTISQGTLSRLSAYNKALSEYSGVKAKYDSRIEKAEKALKKIRDDRHDAEVKGELSPDEIVAAFSTVEAEKTLTTIQAEKAVALKPYNRIFRGCENGVRENTKTGERAIEAIIPAGLYEAYQQVSLTGKNDKFFKACQTMLANLGFEDAGNGATAKFAKQYAAVICKQRKATSVAKAAEGEFVELYRKAGFNRLAMRFFLEYLINVKKVLIVNEDKSLSIRTFDETAPAAPTATTAA